ncbi:MAG: hypothetical protein ACRDGW_13030 [Actinomycetota bacterium]
MTRLQAVYYRAADGSEPVNDFIDRLSIKRQVALDNQIDRLNMLTSQSPHLPILLVLLHAFRKDTGKIPDAEIKIAKERWADFTARMDAQKRQPPRAAGHDAP